MRATINGAPSFAYIDVDLDPGEKLLTESDAMTSMSADLDLKARTNGGFFSALGKKFLGGESFFLSEYTNNTSGVRRVTLTQGTPGNIREVQLNGNSICFQPGAFIAATPGIRLGVRWAGFASWIGREGLFKLVASGQGTVWYGAYGALVDKEVNGEYIVDSGHLVAYDPQLRLRIQLAGGIFSSFFGGEGLVTRVEGRGRIVLQSRSVEGLAEWLNPHL